MNFVDLFKNYSKSIISSQILKSPYDEIYQYIFNQQYDTILILNQGIYVPLYPYFEKIVNQEFHITYVDENELSIQQLNNELIKFKNNQSIRSVKIDAYIETLLSNIYTLSKNRFKNIQYDFILIHHYNSYLSNINHFYQILKSITHSKSEILFFASICNEPNQTLYKNNIRNKIGTITNMNIGTLCSLEEIILSVPQEDFKIKHILPYRESHYIGYGKNMIYKFILEKV